MRGVETRIRDIRHRIFTEVARMAYHTEWPTDRRIEEFRLTEKLASYIGLAYCVGIEYGDM